MSFEFLAIRLWRYGRSKVEHFFKIPILFEGATLLGTGTVRASEWRLCGRKEAAHPANALLDRYEHRPWQPRAERPATWREGEREMAGAWTGLGGRMLRRCAEGKRSAGARSPVAVRAAITGHRSSSSQMLRGLSQETADDSRFRNSSPSRLFSRNT